MRKAALGIGIILLLVLAAGAWLLADLNRFRPQIETLIAEQAGLDIEISGDLSWQLVPGPTITAALIQAKDGRWRADQWRYNPVLDHHWVQGLQFKTAQAEGRCDLEFSPRHSTAAPRPTAAPGIIPLQALVQFNGSGSCPELGLRFADRHFENLTAELEVADGLAKLGLQAPEVFGGTAATQVELDASADPLAWTVRFHADPLQTQELQPWLGEAVQWDAEVAYAGEWQMQGDSVEKLASTIFGESSLDGGPGRIGAPFLDQIKKAASPFARGAGKAAPGPVQYQSLTGTWSIEGAAHRLELALDNLRLKAKGEYRLAEDRLDMTAKVAIEEGADDAAFEANRLLTGIGIPLRCAGTLAKPGCELDGGAVRQLLAEAAKDGTEMQRKVDAIIEEKLPPKQRQAARAVLRLLGGSIKEEQP